MIGSNSLSYQWEGEIIHIMDNDSAFKQLESEQKMKSKRHPVTITNADKLHPAHGLDRLAMGVRDVPRAHTSERCSVP